jgi:hypothetical protein
VIVAGDAGIGAAIIVLPWNSARLGATANATGNRASAYVNVYAPPVVTVSVVETVETVGSAGADCTVMLPESDAA